MYIKGGGPRGGKSDVGSRMRGRVVCMEGCSKARAERGDSTVQAASWEGFVGQGGEMISRGKKMSCKERTCRGGGGVILGWLASRLVGWGGMNH